MPPLATRLPDSGDRIEEASKVCILECGDQVGLNKRDDSGLLASLYELPNREGHLTPEEIPEWIKTGIIRIAEPIRI